MIYIKVLVILFNVFIVVYTQSNEAFCEISQSASEVNKNCGKNKYYDRKRYILYDVNFPEGFNLRRDVYVRVAVFIKNLIDNDVEYDWNLVLPPWNKLYHWKSKNVGEKTQLPWSLFFDINSLKKFIPVMEMYEFMTEYKSNNNIIMLDKVYILQNDLKMFETGDFQERNEITECNVDKINYKKKNGNFIGYFWGYKNITAKDLNCITFHGSTSDLKQNLNPFLYSSFMFDHMEIPLHDYYGSANFWKARRSMRYNPELYDIAHDYRNKFLNSSDAYDNTIRPLDWRNEKRSRDAIGGPYLAVHLRRQDFLTGRANSVPTLKNAASQLTKKMKKLKLTKLFVATDAPNSEFEELKEQLSNYEVFKYNPSDSIRQKFKDGGVAIIDQIICSYARYFIGTYESTFSFRIQEDREIIGFPTKSTFNMLCGNQKCEHSSQWEIVW
ncbi:GDP-fucose protein O-fucosyltransferase 2 [Chelonus insularis]|uniref:GDP-fucose protein O-fucosyltransferase 2 n=1 Tax=Chelonus insularis TaxID=460826 RepID=UPI00158C4CB1|nr:GDP-fucose protein O-fucosyltransferase 2 [Chelonus insularis]